MIDCYDVTIVGGGVTGCACAFELTSLGYRCLLLEKNEHLLSEASSGNSGMLHTGFDALTDSVELDCIRRTQRRIFNVVEKLGVPVNKIGATMVAWNKEQLDMFPKIIEKSNSAGFTSIRQLSISELRQREPNLESNVNGALYIDDEAVTDPWLLPILMANDAKNNGANIMTDARVISVSRDKQWSVNTTRGVFRSKCMVNCGGLYGDILDKLAGQSNFTIRPRKGQYTIYSQSARELINSSIVPVPTSVGKGVIVFRSIYDNVVVGPTAETVESRRKAEIDCAIISRLKIVARDTVPKLTSYPIVNMYTGVRPATDVKDYILKEDNERNWITVGGIRSTGLSGCLGIAERVADLVQNSLSVEATRGVARHISNPEVTISRPEVSFTRTNHASIDGQLFYITHPLTSTGAFELLASKL